MIHACNPSYSGGRDRRIMAQAKLARLYMKKKLKAKTLEACSSGRALV
jgi:hypothetical protein